MANSIIKASIIEFAIFLDINHNPNTDLERITMDTQTLSKKPTNGTNSSRAPRRRPKTLEIVKEAVANPIATTKTGFELLLGPRKKSWSLEGFIMLILGVGMIWQNHVVHGMSVVQETIVVVFFLAGMLGITRIPLPTKVNGRKLPIWAYPIMCAILSCFMDSFLVLLLVAALELSGAMEHQLRFKAINMIAALIGGLMIYFGEVYFLPLALMYGLRDWYSMIPIIPPVLVFTGLLSLYSWKWIDVEVVGQTNNGGDEHKKTTADPGDYVEFVFFIGLLFVTHNALLCLGIMLCYAYLTGQAHDLIEVVKTETEMAVMMLLVLAAFIADPIAPYMVHFEGWWAAIPVSINGVLTGAIYPATGDVWKETHVLSTFVLITPAASLVGVMVFTTLRSWWSYMKIGIPAMVVWCAVCGAWFYSPVWESLEPMYNEYCGTPTLQTQTTHDAKPSGH